MRGFEHGTATLSMDEYRAEKIYYLRGSLSPESWLRGLFGLLFRWHQRWHQRQHLAGLDAHLLRDIGVTPRAALREAGKPFWQT